MKPGPLQTIRFRFWGPSPEAALDRFPNGKIVNRTKDAVTIEAEVYGEGVVMWLLSQAEFLEVLQPKSLRDKMQQTIDKMRQNYLTTEIWSEDPGVIDSIPAGFLHEVSLLLIGEQL